MQNPEHKWIEELFKEESIPDNGFSQRVMAPIPKWWKVLIRRVFIQSTALILGVLGFITSLQFKLPTINTDFEVEQWQIAASNAQEMWADVPRYLEIFSETNLLTIAAILLVAFIFVFTLADLPVKTLKNIQPR